MSATPVTAGPGLRAEAVERVADAVLSDLSDRSGVGDELSMLDAETMAELRQSIGAAALTALLSLLAERGCKIIGPDATPDMLGAFWRTKNAGHRPQPAPVDTSDAAAFRAMLASAPSPMEDSVND